MGDVSRLPNPTTPARKCGKSPAHIGNIPIFGRLSAETSFDRHCVAGRQVFFRFLSRAYGTMTCECGGLFSLVD